jgi:hypothetical protein
MEIISWRNNIGGSVSAKRENNRGVKEISEKHQNNSENISENENSGEENGNQQNENSENNGERGINGIGKNGISSWRRNRPVSAAMKIMKMAKM